MNTAKTKCLLKVDMFEKEIRIQIRADWMARVEKLWIICQHGLWADGDADQI